MLETLRAVESGELNPTPQDEAVATYAPRLRREDGDVDWNLSADVISNRIRAFYPWPGARARIGGQTIKLLRARPLDREARTPRTIGSFLGLDEGRLMVQCGQGTVLGLEVVQLPGRRPITALEYWRSLEREPESLGE
jgi:methionyl-tRNA formyltransferase